MTRTIALLFASTLMLTVAACDSGEEPVEDRAAELPDADADPDELEAKPGHHGKRNPAAKLCAALECSDAQAAEIAELFASRHEGRDGAAHEARKAARAEAHQAIADAFRAEEFDAGVLDRVAPDPDAERGEHEAAIVEFAAQLHAILSAEQRAELAELIEARGPMVLGPQHGPRGKHGKHGKHGSKAEAKRDPAERVAAKVERLCAPLDCTDAQATELSATFEAAHAARHDGRAKREADKPDFGPIAAAFLAETLDEAALKAALADGKRHMAARKAEHGEQLGATLAQIHAILTPEQRAIVADKIAAEGLRAVIGGRGKHGKRGHGRRGPSGDAR